MFLEKNFILRSKKRLPIFIHARERSYIFCWKQTPSSYPFLEFLNRNHALYDKERNKVLSNDALVAITLMIAESKPEEKDMMVDIVMNLLVSSPFFYIFNFTNPSKCP